MSNVQEALQSIFEAGVEAGKGRDAIIVEMVSSGEASLNMAQNVYKDLAKLAGLSKARVGHKKEALERIAESGVDVLDEEARLELKADLAAHFGVSNGTAHDYIRAYAVENDIALNLGGPISKNAEEIYEFIASNPNMDKPMFRDFMVSLGRSKGNIDETWRGVMLARRIITEGAWDNVEFLKTDAA